MQTTTLKIDGFYNVYGDRFKVKGEVNVDPDGFIRGQSDGNHRLEGKVLKIEEGMRIALFNISKRQKVANYFCFIDKKKSQTLTGRYKGQFHILPLEHAPDVKQDVSRLSDEVLSKALKYHGGGKAEFRFSKVVNN